MSDSNRIIVIVVVCIFGLGILVGVGELLFGICWLIFQPVFESIKSKRLEKVAKKSPLYQELLELNAEYEFKPVKDTFTFTTETSSKREYDDFDFDAQFGVICEKNKKDFRAYADDVEFNNKLLSQYNREYNRIKERAKPHSAEMSVLEKNKLCPVTTVTIVVQVKYHSPKFKTRLNKSNKYDISRVGVTLDHAAKMRKEYHARRRFIERERSLMTESLRYEVLRRDNFRCVICGATAEDGVLLHVDHIKPVSKGGKTEMSNLRTLCERCNRGKSDRYYEGELN